MASEAKVKHSTTLALYAEHKRLREEVACQRGQSRDDAARVKICARHQDLDTDVQLNYLKIGRRIERFQHQMPQGLPLMGYAALGEWYRIHQDLW